VTREKADKIVVNCSSSAGLSKCKHIETAYKEVDGGCSQKWAGVVHTSGPVCAQNAELFHSVLEVWLEASSVWLTRY